MIANQTAPACREIKIIDHNSADYLQMVSLRYKLLREPLGLKFSDEDLAAERDDVLLLCTENETTIGCAVLSGNGPGVMKLRQMAVDSGWQGKGIGGKIVAFAEQYCLENHFETMVLHARKTAAGFYEKLGYRITGNEFIKVSIPHFAMEKKQA